MIERDEIDEQRATSEGMAQPLFEKDFLLKIVREFKSRPIFTDIGEVAQELMGKMKDGEIDDLRMYMEIFLTKEELKELNDLEVTRQLDYYHFKTSTGG